LQHLLHEPLPSESKPLGSKVHFASRSVL
jgi:hypothetical protein